MSAAPSVEAWRQYRLRCSLGASTADAYHRAGFSVVLQDVVVGEVLSGYVASIQSRPRVVVVLAPTAGAVAAREALRAKTAYRPSEGLDIAEWDAAFRRETPRIGMWLDTSEQTPAETVEAIIYRGLEGPLSRLPLEEASG
jgi:hypothetical protein